MSLATLIANRIQQSQGKIPFVDFMQYALYEPGYGYYTANQGILGKQGDFVTAPEISPLFAACLSTQISQVFESITKTKTLFELGAGTGKLACDVLNQLALKEQLPDQYVILESSAVLKAKQKMVLSALPESLFSKITWLDTLPETPIQGVILANEVIDAMPVHRVCYDNKQWQEYYVNYQHDQFNWEIGSPGCDELFEYWEQLNTQDLPMPYSTEINVLAKPWLTSINHVLEKGMILLIDYGFPRHEYYHPSRHQGTLMCHYQHQAHDNPLIHIGEQDITAHVDFTQLASTAKMLQLQVTGFTSQAAFLLNCDLLTHLQQAQTRIHTMADQTKLNQQVHTLTAPQEMGELFKVMALTRDIPVDLCGFLRHDQRYRLR